MLACTKANKDEPELGRKYYSNNKDHDIESFTTSLNHESKSPTKILKANNRHKLKSFLVLYNSKKILNIYINDIRCNINCLNTNI